MAVDITGSSPAGERKKLADVLPLDTPYMIEVFPIYACNLKCNYCMMSTPKTRHGYIADKTMIDSKVFADAMIDAEFFPEKIRVLRFAGLGEPLLHRLLPAMVARASFVAEQVEILTNATMLTPEKSLALLDAGVTRLVISIQGTTREQYRRVCGVDVDLDKLIDQIRYFYERRQGAVVYCKIADSALNGPGDEARFHDLFGPVCDLFAVERTVPIHPVVDYKALLGDRAEGVTQFNQPAQEVTVCPRPFMSMHILPDGNVVPCYSLEYPAILGNVQKKALTEIWRGPEMAAFRRDMLNGSRETNAVCSRCKIVTHRVFGDDCLDADAERLRAVYGG